MENFEKNGSPTRVFDVKAYKVKAKAESKKKTNAFKVKNKVCPFMSSGKNFVNCMPRCKLYREGKGNYTCFFMEQQAISWNTKEILKAFISG